MKAIFLALFAFTMTACGETTIDRPDTPMKDKAEAQTDSPIPSDESKVETITLGAGCFWCVEAVYQQLEGVHSVTSGYMGGHVENPTYEQVCSKTTGHIEVVQVKFDPNVISTSDVIDWFWKLHDPTSRDKQGADEGPQYRSAIFYHSPEQKELAEKSMKAAQADFSKPIVTDIRKAETYYIAEANHQDFYFREGGRNGYCRAVIAPKLRKLKLRN